MPDRAVHSDDSFRSGRFVQTVDVLRDDREARKPPAPGGEDLVRAIGAAAGDEAAAPVVPAPHQAWIPRERLRRRELLRPEIPPQAPGATEGRYAARRRN